ncbi:MAG: glycosyltransferase family 4 protein [Candidatus Bathyarchaeota archaeon]|nr:glycosyltransferase family 4 protein [Candidatus Bathyarchaeota archaeon]
MKRLAIVTTHPIQYNAPWFRLLAKNKQVQLKVFYTWSQTKEGVRDKTFGREIRWDIPLLEGYTYEFVENISKNPGSNRWSGIDNPDLISKIERYDPGAILIFGWNMKSHLQTMRYFKGKVPVWFRGDSTLLDETGGIKTVLRRLWLRYVYSKVDKVFCVGRESKKYFLVHGLEEEQLVLAPHAIDNERFFDSSEKQYEQKAKEWRKELGYNENDQVILFAGKFEEKKDPKILISAFKDLRRNGIKDLKLLLVGNGPLEEEIAGLTKNDLNIQLLPFQNQTKMPLVYRLGNIFCLPSKGPGETWGLAVNEAMACGRPVIISDKAGCAPDLVKGKKVGNIFKASNLPDLQESLFKMLEQDINSFGENARQEIEKWNYDRITNAILKTFDTPEKSQFKNKKLQS